ncbi:MAG: peptide-binding protein [Candidatus Krumholzibacteria bacterium]|nr:peptide-binding protein [Candidatus Krumholzibacteria bacterium]
MRLLRHGVLVAILVVTACSNDTDREGAAKRNPPPVEQPAYGGTVLRHLQSDCKTLNWVLYTTVYEDYVLRYLYDYLLDYDADLQIVPVLAESYDISKDHLRITVTLRDSVRWHDGEFVTSDDVKFTVDKILDPAIPAVNKRSWFEKLDKIETPDHRTAVFVWSEPYAPALHALTQLAPIPKHVYGQSDFMEHPANRAPVGNGAFKFEEWRTSQTISLLRNDDYYRDNAYVDRVVFRIIPDQAVALAALKTGELDEMKVRQLQWETQTNDKEFLKKFEKSYYYVPQYNYLAWNCRSVWFKDKRVRKAMTLLFDRQSLNEKVYSGYAELVSGPFYINSWAYDKSIDPLPFDPQAAKKLLDEAGWIDSDNDGIREREGVNFEFEFSSTGSRIALEFAQLLQEECAKVGIGVEIRQLEGSTYFDKVYKGEYDAAALSWRLDNDPDIYDTFHSSEVPPIGLNHTFYSNTTVDSLLELGKVEFDPDRRREIYHRVHRLIHEDQPYTFVNSVPEKRPISKRIGNVVISPDGPFRFYPGAIYWFIKSDFVNAKK